MKNTPGQTPPPAAVGVWTRRTFLQTGTGLLLSFTTSAKAAPSAPRSLIDVNVNLSRWPLRRLPLDQSDRLVKALRSHGVSQAWTGTFDGLLHKDITSANQRLVEECRQAGPGLLLPFGSVNPTLPGWIAETRRCAETHRMRGIRLHPNYHGYTLDDPRFRQLLQLATDLNLIVQLALIMEDARMMHPLLRVALVDTQPLAGMVRSVPGLRLVLLNSLGLLRGPTLTELTAAGNVSVDIAMLEGVAGVENLLKSTPADRILFGSHAPLFYFEAAELKLKESFLSEEQADLIRSGNAQRLTA